MGFLKLLLFHEEALKLPFPPNYIHKKLSPIRTAPFGKIHPKKLVVGPAGALQCDKATGNKIGSVWCWRGSLTVPGTFSITKEHDLMRSYSTWCFLKIRYYKKTSSRTKSLSRKENAGNRKNLCWSYRSSLCKQVMPQTGSWRFTKLRGTFVPGKVLLTGTIKPPTVQLMEHGLNVEMMT